MKQLTDKGFKITQVFMGNTTLVQRTTGMIVEAERSSTTGACEWSLFDKSETHLFTGSCSSDVANYINNMKTV